MPQTLYDKLWNQHVVHTESDGTALLYIDRHLVHEVTSPQAFEGLRLAGRGLWRVAANLAVADHNVPTTERSAGIADPISRLQVETLDANARHYGFAYFNMRDLRQGIVHIIGPEQEVEHVLATQPLLTKKAKSMRVEAHGVLPRGCTAKDLVLAVIGMIGTAGGNGYAIEFAGSAIRALSMEGRMTVCNMAIAAGARAGMIACDETTLNYVRHRPLAPAGVLWERAVSLWSDLHSDAGARFDRVVEIDAATVKPQVTWGTSPEMVLTIEDRIPDPDREKDPAKRQGIERALEYMGLLPNTPIGEIRIDKVFIGSCTNARIEDLRDAARVISRLGKRRANNVQLAMVVPGSGLVKAQAEAEGLDQIFRAAGFEWRDPGCSMCLAMNADRLLPGERCASTSNRNFEGRQGQGGRTHLVSPAMAAAAGIEGHFVDVRRLS